MSKSSLLLAALIAASVFGRAARAGEAIDIGSRLELMVDRHLIERTTGGARLRLHRPTPREVAIVHDAPWEGNCTAHHNVFRDGDIIRMYYGGRHYEPGGGPMRHSVICYAESKDGIHWTRPNMGLFEYEGSKENNIVWMGDLWSKSEQRNPFGIFKDTNPNCPPESRYKSVGRGDDGVYALRSADGIRWSLMSERPVIPKGDMTLDSQNLAFWDGVRGRYVCYLRSSHTYPNGQRVRDVKTATSADFLHWSEPAFLLYGDAPVEHLYTNQIWPYFRTPHNFLGFPKRFLPSRQAAGHEHPGVSDGIFMTSRDGLNFRRWSEAIVRPGLQKDRWVNRNNMTGWGILATKSDIAGVPDELSIYVTEGYYTGPSSRLRRYTYRMDGFVSVEAPLAGGQVVTKPLVFAGSALRMNFSTSAAGSVRVEIQDRDGAPIPGFALSDCPPIYGDDIQHEVVWEGEGELAALAGRPVRLRFELKDADLFAFRFR